MQRRIDRAVPARVEIADHTPGLQLGEQALHGVAEGYARRHLRHQPEVEPLRAELAAGRRLARALAPGELHVALGPADAVAGEKGKTLQRQGHAVGVALALEAAFEFFEAQALDLVAQTQRDGAQRNIDDRVDRLAVLHVEPAAQRADPLAQLERQGHMLAQRVHIGARQAGVQRAAPAPPVTTAREQRLRQPADKTEALAPVGRRRRIEAHLVLAQAVAKHQLHIAQRKRRGAALLVEPAQRAAAHDDLVLLEEPVGGGAAMAAVGAAEIEAGDEDAAARVTAHIELGAVDQQLLEAQFERQQGTRRNRREHAWQAQRRLLPRVEQQHLLQLERRHPATGPNLDPADAHRHAEHPAGLRLERAAPLLDVGQNPPMKSQPGDQQQAPRDHHHGDRHPRQHQQRRHPAQRRPARRGHPGHSRLSVERNQ